MMNIHYCNGEISFKHSLKPKYITDTNSPVFPFLSVYYLFVLHN